MSQTREFDGDVRREVKPFMSTLIATIEADREREIEVARAEVLRRAEAQGVKPFTGLEDLAGDPQMVANFDVDEFLRQVRQERERTSTRSLE